MVLKRKSLMILLNILGVYCSRYINYILPNITSDVTEVSQCVVDIVVKSNFYKPTLLIYINDKPNKAFYTSMEAQISEVIVHSGIPIILLIDSSSYITKTTDIKAGLIIVTYIKSCKIFDDFINSTITKNYKYFIIIHETLIFKCNDNIQKMANNVAAKDVTFIYKDKMENAFILATFMNELSAENCKMQNTINLTYINTCKNVLLTKGNVDVFPNKKPKNWMRCPLKVGLAALYPYNKSYNKSLQNLTPLREADGSDVEIMKIVAHYFNASLNFYHIKTDAENARLKSSFIPFILNGTLEVCVGGLYRVFGDIVSYSGIYSKQEIIWVYTTERATASWLTFARQTDGIYIFLIFYLCYSTLWCIFCYFDGVAISFPKTLVYAWGALYGTASLQDARTIKQKILNLSYMLLCIHLLAYVSIQWYSVLTIHRPPHVYKNTEELSQSEVPVYLIAKAKYFITEEKYVAYANTSENCSDFDDCLIKTVKNKGTTILLDGIFASVQSNTAVNDEASMLRATEAIIVVYHEMVIRKESLLVDRFGDVIERLFEAGICQRLYEEAIGILVVDKARRANQNMLSNSYSCTVGCKITMSQCVGAFYLWILGCIISCCIFCFEIVISKQRKQIN